MMIGRAFKPCDMVTMQSFKLHAVIRAIENTCGPRCQEKSLLGSELGLACVDLQFLAITTEGTCSYS